jgi:hypothetical protein
MPKVKPKDFKEGEVITKSDILETRTAIEDIDLDIDQENIREEGLDRRLFSRDQVNKSYPVRVFSTKQSQRLPRTTTFRKPRFDTGTLENSLNPVFPELSIQWDTEKDTHAIVRCSMFVETRGDSHTHMNDDAWEFGLQIVKPGQGIPSEGADLGLFPYFIETQHVWPYQRVCLTGAFSGKRHDGFIKNTSATLVRTEGFSDFFTGSDYPWLFSGSVRDDYPRGAWNQYAMNRSSSWNASITLIAHITSNMTELENSCHHVDETGEIRVIPVYRCLIPGEHTGRPRIKNIELSYQTFRR